jgi:hypothetical protein
MGVLKKIVTSILIPPFFALTIPAQSLANPDMVKLAEGTPVILRLTEEVSSATKNANETVNLEVARDVVVDGKVVIKSGTPAIATVTMAEKRGVLGKAGKIQISVESTKAIDGQKVMLRSTVTQSGKDESTTAVVGTVICCVLFLLMKGKDAVLPIGSEVKAYTETAMTIEVQ